ncbi:MAG: hypothetical protein AB1306_10110 [Nitrospirota bacterium]
MDDFIVRVYRRDENNVLVGIVEDIREGLDLPFHNIEELWTILQRPGSGKGVASVPRENADAEAD